MSKLTEYLDYYINEEDRMVLTSKYLLDRGYCCGNGCKHCPYDYKNVPEPRRKKLLADRDSKQTNKNK